jgi:hypothetical protein
MSEYEPAFAAKAEAEADVEILVVAVPSKATVYVHYKVGVTGIEWIDYCIFDRQRKNGDDGEYGYICTASFAYDENGVGGGGCGLGIQGHGNSRYDTPFALCERLGRLFGVDAKVIADATESAIEEQTGGSVYEMFAGAY